mgnify:CR=1 FL=1
MVWAGGAGGCLGLSGRPANTHSFPNRMNRGRSICDPTGPSATGPAPDTFGAMSKTIYILTHGHPDSGLRAVAFSTREGAEAAVPFGDEYSEIMELVLDPVLPVAPEGHSFWRYCNDVGQGEWASPCSYFDDASPGQVSCEDGFYLVDLWARDKGHALEEGRWRMEAFMKMNGEPA